MSAAWKGAITLGGFPLGVALHERTSRNKPASLRMLDPSHQQPVKQQLIDCKGQPVERGECGRGVETIDGVAPLTPEGLAMIEETAKKSSAVDIARFVPAAEVPTDLALSSFVVVPDGSADQLSVLWNGLRSQKLAAIVEQWTPRTGSKPSTLAITATADGLSAYVIPFANEVKHDAPAWKPKRDRKAAELFGAFVGAEVEQFNLSHYVDQHAARREQAIAQALAGHVAKPSPSGEAAPAPVVDLMAALQARVAKTKGKPRAKAAA